MAESSSPAEVDYLEHCAKTVRSLEHVLASDAPLLSSRQWNDLSSKLSEATRNVGELVLYSTSITLFRPCLENLHRCLEKAETFVSRCAKGDQCGAAILQIEKESAFRDILEEVGSCYKTIYDVAKGNGAPEDLQQSSVFEYVVHADHLDLEKRLNEFAQVELLNLCRKIVLRVRSLVRTDKVLLNRRQCVDLSSKLCITALNVLQLVLCGGASVERFQLGLKTLYRVLERSEALVRSCGDDDWLAAAVFQIDNENAFRMILLDVSLCYNALYDLANNPPMDLRDPSLSMFMPTRSSDVDEDRGDLQKRLDDLANGFTKSKAMDYLSLGKTYRKQSLAGYLLVKMCARPLDPQVAPLDVYSALLWRKASEPRFTWGNSRFLGSGSGASGVVSTTWLGIPCAKKEFHGQENECFFLKEAGILAHLKHPCVVDFICCGNGLEKGDRFIAMELMERSLADLIDEQVKKGAHFQFHVVVDIMVQIARGVCYLHGRGVAHRDIKPQNVVVSKLCSLDGESHYSVKLVDFGMSKTKVGASKVNTMSAFGIGTTQYRAPEVGPQAHQHGSGRTAWFKADAYSFAITCAHLLSLKTPFGEVKVMSKLFGKLMNGERPCLPSDCPKEIATLLEDCWNTGPELRPTFGEVCTRLEEFKYAMLGGFVGGNEGDQSSAIGLDFIKRKVEEQYAYQMMLGNTLNDEEEEKAAEGELHISTCLFGHALEFLPQELFNGSVGSYCSICWEVGSEFYYCQACDFGIHLHCSKLELEVNVFFHHHPLQLLIRNYHNGNPAAICCICEEQMQHSEWVYRCETCDIDVHALCTKLPQQTILNRDWHEHPLIMRQCPPSKTLSCASCNGEVRANSWMYTCLKKCTYCVCLSCIMWAYCPVCVFDIAHKLSLIRTEEGFYCSSCGGLGISWYYHCNDCDVNIHLDCLDDMVVEDNWDEVYEELTTKYMTSNDNRIPMDKIVQLLDQLLMSGNLGESSWSSSTPTLESTKLLRKVRPIIPRHARSETPDLSAVDFNDADQRKKLAVETMERKAKRMAIRACNMESKAKRLRMLENLERTILYLQSRGDEFEGDVAIFDARLEKLKIEKDDVVTLVQSRMRHSPRTYLFYEEYEHKNMYICWLVTDLRADMKDVLMRLLCEEPAHQHAIDGSEVLTFPGAIGEERVRKLQALLGRGLEVVTRVMSASAGELPRLDRVKVPVLGSKFTWDLTAIDVEKHGIPSKVEESVSTFKMEEDSAAEWILSKLESHGIKLFKSCGLLRVWYIETEKGDCPRYTRGSVAWLCKEHVDQGLKAGILKLYPMKYYDSELN